MLKIQVLNKVLFSLSLTGFPKTNRSVAQVSKKVLKIPPNNILEYAKLKKNWCRLYLISSKPDQNNIIIVWLKQQPKQAAKTLFCKEMKVVLFSQLRCLSKLPNCPILIDFKNFELIKISRFPSFDN